MKDFKWFAAAVLYIAFAKANTLHAQQGFRAIATYLVQSKFEVRRDTAQTTENAEQSLKSEKLREALTRGTQQNYRMEFTATESSYDEVKELAKPLGPGDFTIQVRTYNGSTSKVYKNLKEQKSYRADAILGKPFVIIDTMKYYDWQLSRETKKIGNYTCYKATYTPELTAEEKSAIDEKNKNGSSSGLFEMIADDDPTITVWYTPEIPISNGPGIYHGLPGLILKVNERDTILLCTKIEVHPEERLKLKKPRSGKIISQGDFELLREEKLGKDSSTRGNQEIFINKG